MEVDGAEVWYRQERAAEQILRREGAWLISLQVGVCGKLSFAKRELRGNGFVKAQVCSAKDEPGTRKGE